MEKYKVSKNLVSAHPFQNAVAYLESLAIGDQQAHPAASKECIDRLPQISITDDCNGMDKTIKNFCKVYKNKLSFLY